ncbi:MAG: serine protease [Halieaceae bacterium]|nr:serine protease [Halieaceae bacterium]
MASALAAILITMLVPPQSLAQALPDLIERVMPSVVGVGAAFAPRVPTGGKPPRRLLGSGFVVGVSDNTVVVTNAHVLPEDLDRERGERIAVFSGRGREAVQRFARVLVTDEAHDLALLAYEGPTLPAMRLAAATPMARPGERVAFTGFPIGAVLGLFPTTHEGIVSAITPIARAVDRGRELSAVQMQRLRNPFEVYQLDAIAYPGNSGSAVYRAGSGEVIGVMNSVFVKESRESLLSNPSAIAYAIPVAHVHALLSKL